ncbi:MAG: hypothetical protein WC750_05990 [Patescibacteria group bacterium]|jgi:hypothetical protein
MDFFVYDDQLTVKEIEKFIEENDVHRVFSTRFRWHGEFVRHFEKLIAAKQILIFRQNGRLAGMCSWALVNNHRKKDINKSRWTLPDNVSEGNILYIDVCLLQSGASIFKIKTHFMRNLWPVFDEVFWYNIPNSKVFRLKIKGGTTCPKEVPIAV